MDQDDCLCRAKGRLFVQVESAIERQVSIMIEEEHGYQDHYTIYLHEGKGCMRIDSIAFGKVRITSSIDCETTCYYPSPIILFQKDDFIHKVTMIDRRKKDD